MYHQYFGLKEPAFSIAVNPKYLYMSRQHKEALAHLIYGVQSGGFVMLSGEVGTGKTTIIRCLLDQLPKRTEIAIILNPMASVEEMLQTICEELGVKVWSDDGLSAKSLTDSLYSYLLENHTQQKSTVLLIDEAQLLSAEVLEQIRLLTNLETASQKLLQIVLVGQPELNDLLAQPRLRQLSQRITARFHLKPLSERETALYIRHRLRVAGKKDAHILFPQKIVQRIHQFSNGVPRLINILCERLLIGAYGHNKQQIDDETYKIAQKEVEGNRKIIDPTKTILQADKLRLIIIAGGAIFLFLLSIILWLSLSSNTVDSDPVASGTINRTLESFPRAEPGEQAPIDLSKGVETSNPNVIVTENTSDFEIPLESIALQTLFEYHNQPSKLEAHPCWQANKHGYTCERLDLKTWDDLRELNRPVILGLVTEDKRKVFTVLISLSDSMSKLLTPDNKSIIVPLKTLGKLWDSEVLYIWKKPKTFTKALSLGVTSPAVGWVAKQFSIIDQQTIPLAKNTFTKPLEERVKIFQAQYNLDSDGIIGERTILKLNEALGLATELNDTMRD